LPDSFDIRRQNACASYQDQWGRASTTFWYLLILQRTTFLFVLLFATRKLFADNGAVWISITDHCRKRHLR